MGRLDASAGTSRVEPSRGGGGRVVAGSGVVGGQVSDDAVGDCFGFYGLHFGVGEEPRFGGGGQVRGFGYHRRHARRVLQDAVEIFAVAFPDDRVGTLKHGVAPIDVVGREDSVDLFVQYPGETFRVGVVSLVIDLGSRIGGAAFGAAVVMDGNERVRVESTCDLSTHHDRYPHVGSASKQDTVAVGSQFGSRRLGDYQVEVLFRQAVRSDRSVFGASVTRVEYDIDPGQVGARGDDPLLPAGRRDPIPVFLYLTHRQHQPRRRYDHTIARRVRCSGLGRGNPRRNEYGDHHGHQHTQSQPPRCQNPAPGQPRLHHRHITVDPSAHPLTFPRWVPSAHTIHSPTSGTLWSCPALVDGFRLAREQGSSWGCLGARFVVVG